jgi:hypothetical protein
VRVCNTSDLSDRYSGLIVAGWITLTYYLSPRPHRPAILDLATHLSSIHENTIFIQKYMHRIHVPTRYSNVKSKRVARAINR